MDNEDNVERHFSLEDLRKLFELNEETDSDTHDRSAIGRRCHLGGGHTSRYHHTSHKYHTQ